MVQQPRIPIRMNVVRRQMGEIARRNDVPRIADYMKTAKSPLRYRSDEFDIGVERNQEIKGE